VINREGRNRMNLTGRDFPFVQRFVEGCAQEGFRFAE
jgi:hypothetical protein